VSSAEPHRVFLEPLHDAPDRFETEGAPSGEHDAVHGGNQMAGIEELESMDAGRPPADFDAAYRGMVGQHDRETGESDRIGGVSDADSGDHGPDFRVGARLTSASLTRPSATSAPISSPRMASALTNGMC